MSRSSKIIVASCVCAAFLAIGIGCTVEDRDIEEKGVFQCKSDNDCLEGSKCVKAKEGEDVIGRCTREDEIDHCVDNDGDGFYTSESQFDVECGYTETRPKDPDDTNPMIYFGASEICDGFDNSGDGCVDGICEAGADCKADSSKCKIIEKPCWGGGSISNYDKSVCSKAIIGYEKCEDGVLKYVPGSDADLAKLGACPTSTSQIKGYVDVESDSTCNNGIDDNCNTMVDEGCTSCSAELAKDKSVACYVTKAGFGKAMEADVGDTSSDYGIILGACNNDKNNCKCIGKLKCSADDSQDPYCADANGNDLTSLDLSSEACYSVFE